MRNFLLGILVSISLFSIWIVPHFVYKPILTELVALENQCFHNQTEYFFWGCVEATSGETELCREITKEQIK